MSSTMHERPPSFSFELLLLALTLRDMLSQSTTNLFHKDLSLFFHAIAGGIFLESFSRNVASIKHEEG